MVLDNLGRSLHKALTKLTGSRDIDEEAVRLLKRDIQRALLVADVNVKLVGELTTRIEDRALNEEPPAGISKRHHVVNIVYEELTNFLGRDRKGISFAPANETTTVMLVGIQGSGKTTTTVKLARYFQKRGRKTAIVCSDTWRPAALEQLEMLAEGLGIPVYGDREEDDAVELAQKGLAHFDEKDYDLVVVDTAGRHKEETGLIQEMRTIASEISPDEIILVIDATLGQQARSQANAFSEATEIGSILVTKLDGSAKGGGALSACAETGAPIKFIGVGETIEDLEPFNPPRFVGRLLGMGDISTLIEKFEEATRHEELTEEYMYKFLEGKFTLQDMAKQMEMLSNMGPLSKVIQMIPGMGFELPDEALKVGEDKLKRFKIIMSSMNKGELTKPKSINSSRISRIARGSGSSEQEVRELLKQYEMMKKMMRSMGKSRRFRGRAMRKMIGGQPGGKMGT
jgi:signal recognition particle subunit SRP54